MNTRRMMRWAIVLFLLAALPVVTAVVAQGQEPAGKAPLPAVMEVGESPTSVPWVNNETQYNDTLATAESKYLCGDGYYFNCVLGGTINGPGDVDYWGLEVGTDYVTHFPVLLDIDARSFNSPLDAVICLYADDGVLVGCNDDTDTYDSMLYFNFEKGRTYYLRVTDWGGRGGSDFKYQLYASTPLLISATTSGTVAGIRFQPGDVLAYSCADGLGDPLYFGCHAWKWEKWVMFLDLSDLQVAGNLSNLAAGWRNSDLLFLGFAGNVTLPGVAGPVTPWEVVTFNPTQIGPATAGSFARWWSVKDHGLTTAGAKIDALDWPTWQGITRMYLSTAGAVNSTYPNEIVLADEDVGLYTWPGIGGGYWERFFDGNGVDGLAVEDVVAMDLAEKGSYDSWMMLVIQGSGVVGENRLRVTQKDIFLVGRMHGPPDSPWNAELFWHGPAHGWNYNIDAIDFPVLDMDCLEC